jgi:hypothetical protein
MSGMNFFWWAYLLRYIHADRASKTTVVIQSEESRIPVFFCMREILIPFLIFGELQNEPPSDSVGGTQVFAVLPKRWRVQPMDVTRDADPMAILSATKRWNKIRII